MNDKIELLAPAGNGEKLQIAIEYGADAVYLAGKDYSLRNFSGNFTVEELKNAIAFAHESGVKVYVAVNIFPRNDEIEAISHYLDTLGKLNPDAIIISDPGILMLSRNRIPHIPVHLSTQANTTNYESARFWQGLGVKRINTARELTLEEINRIVSKTSLEVETFVHGAMCVSYSGRCLLSSFMTNRDSNRGKCSHPCRWKYTVVEELRPGAFMPVFEDDRGAYIFNSKDLCLIHHIPELIKAGIHSIKIEGRMKGIHYLAVTVKTYRQAIDACYDDSLNFTPPDDWMEELLKTGNRGYCTGFFFGAPDSTRIEYDKSVSGSHAVFLAKVLANGPDAQPGKIPVEVRNKLFVGEPIEVFRKNGPVTKDRIHQIFDTAGSSIEFAQPGSNVFLSLDFQYQENDLIRRPTPSDEQS